MELLLGDTVIIKGSERHGIVTAKNEDVVVVNLIEYKGKLRLITNTKVIAKEYYFEYTTNDERN